MLPRGIRNNNPCNLRKTGLAWKGQDPMGDDPEFTVFLSPFWGYRAAARTLYTYWNSRHLNTITDIINRWAPPVENPTDAYVVAVASRMRAGPFEKLNMDDPMVVSDFVKALSIQENGANPESSDGLWHNPEMIIDATFAAMERMEAYEYAKWISSSSEPSS